MSCGHTERDGLEKVHRRVSGPVLGIMGYLVVVTAVAGTVTRWGRAVFA